jgi:hypothetical protein
MDRVASAEQDAKDENEYRRPSADDEAVRDFLSFKEGVFEEPRPTP